MKEKPLVSVCIPVYNNADYIAETMHSVMAQTYPAIECILVDDNSSDQSLMVIRQTAEAMHKAGTVSAIFDCTNNEIQPDQTTGEIDFTKSCIPAPDRRSNSIFIYHNNSNLGMSGNWNRCMQLCRGDFIKLICADDQIHPSLISLEVKLMMKYPEALLVESDTEFRDNENHPAGHYVRYGHGLMDGRRIAMHSLFTRDYFGAPLANLVRTSAYRKYGGFDPQFSYIVDYDFYMNIACHGKVYVIRKPLNYFRLRNDSNTGEVLGGDQGKAYTEEHRRLVEKYAAVLGLSRFQRQLSVQIRRLTSFLGGIYLKIKLIKGN